VETDTLGMLRMCIKTVKGFRRSSLIAQRHALTNIHLRKASRVSLCTRAVMGDSEG